MILTIKSAIFGMPLAWMIWVAAGETSPIESFNWTWILEKYGLPALIIAYLIARGEKKLDRNSKAVEMLAAATDRSNRINLIRMARTTRDQDPIKEEMEKVLQEIPNQPAASNESLSN